MKDRPILMRPEMVRATIDGLKTQTRRMIKPQPADQGLVPGRTGNNVGLWLTGPRLDVPHEQYSGNELYKCPYGQPGDLLWVRETFGIEESKYYKPNSHTPVGGTFEEEVFYKADAPNLPGMRWKPSIHMPKRLARLWLKVVDVRVDRVKDISEEDAIAEGVFKEPKMGNHKDAFFNLWDEIYGLGQWQENHWVWVIQFEVISTTGRPEVAWVTEPEQCGDPCHPDDPCNECANYWQRMRDEGLWDDQKGWTEKAKSGMRL